MSATLVPWPGRWSAIVPIKMTERRVGLITLRKEHREAVAHALLNLQFAEQGMRVYLNRCFVAIKARLEDVFPYTRSGADIRTKSWSQLLTELKQMCANEALLRKLDKLTAVRNFCAHQAMLIEVSEDHERFTKSIKRLEGIEATAHECAMDLFDEIAAHSQRAAKPFNTRLRPALDANDQSAKKP